MEKRKIKSKAKRKPRSKKAKVKLDTTKVVMLCSIIACVCVCLLAINIFFTNKTSNQQKKSDSPTVIEEKLETTKKTESEKSKTQKKESQSSKIVEKKEASSTKLQEKKEASSTKPQEKKSEKNNEKDAQNSKKTSENVQTSSSNIVSEKKETIKETVKEIVKETVKEPFNIPEAKNNAVLVIVFDDGGQNVSQLKKCLALKFPVTIAVMPKLPHSKECAELVRRSGKELMLHQPMQAINLSINPGAGAIKPEMSLQEVEDTVRQNILEIGPIAGMNNHEGSLITEDENKMMAVLETANSQGAFFMDSRTTSQSRVREAAMELGLSYYQRDIFLDNEKTRANIISEVEKGLKIANTKGNVVMIGHVWSADILPDVLEELYPFLIAKGYRFSTVTKSLALIKP